MGDFSYNKKKEHEALAEKALRERDYATAMYHTAQAAEFTFALAEQCDGKLRDAYLRNANDLVEIVGQLKQKAKAPRQAVGADASARGSDETATVAPGKCRVAERPKVRLDDVAGMQDVKEQLRLRMIEPLKRSEEAKKHGLAVGGGILLYGPPGTGKTFLAKAVAGELDLPFYSITSADVFGKYVGESENNIRAIFEDVRKNPLSVVFIDELETIFRKRTESIHETTQKVITVILQELDGVKEGQNPILLLGATNTPWMIDEAFLRTGRFDVLAYVGLPDLEARIKILENCFKDVAYPVDADAIQVLARRTEGFSGADLKGIAQRIKQKAFDAKLERYTRALFEECAGEAKPSRNHETMEKIREWEKSMAVGQGGNG